MYSWINLGSTVVVHWRQAGQTKSSQAWIVTGASGLPITVPFNQSACTSGAPTETATGRFWKAMAATTTRTIVAATPMIQIPMVLLSLLRRVRVARRFAAVLLVIQKTPLNRKRNHYQYTEIQCQRQAVGLNFHTGT